MKSTRRKTRLGVVTYFSEAALKTQHRLEMNDLELALGAIEATKRTVFSGRGLKVGGLVRGLRLDKTRYHVSRPQ
jgi:hypothetical protein